MPTVKFSPKLDAVVKKSLADKKVDRTELISIRRTLYAEIDAAKDRARATRAALNVFAGLAPRAKDSKATHYLAKVSRVFTQRLLVEQAAQELPAYLKKHRSSLSPLLRRIVDEDDRMRLGTFTTGEPFLAVHLVNALASTNGVLANRMISELEGLIKKDAGLRKFEDVAIMRYW